MPTIRYYEEIGLLPRSLRQDGGQRVFGEADVERLTFIRRCRQFGFSIEQVKTLAGLMQNPRSSCTDARDLAATQLLAVREQQRELKALERSLETFVKCCDATCVGGPGPECVILGDLGKRV